MAFDDVLVTSGVETAFETSSRYCLALDRVLGVSGRGLSSVSVSRFCKTVDFVLTLSACTEFSSLPDQEDNGFDASGLCTGGTEEGAGNGDGGDTLLTPSVAVSAPVSGCGEASSDCDRDDTFGTL